MNNRLRTSLAGQEQTTSVQYVKQDRGAYKAKPFFFFLQWDIPIVPQDLAKTWLKKCQVFSHKVKERWSVRNKNRGREKEAGEAFKELFEEVNYKKI